MATFQDRQKTLFDELSAAEQQATQLLKCTSPSANAFEMKRSKQKIKQTMRQFRGKESIFKRPEAPLKHCLAVRNIPDHKRNPHKWKYYNLESVSPDDMTEASNTATALAFLQELEERKDVSDKMELETSAEQLIQKPQFHISATVKAKCDVSENKANEKHFINSKVVMPEYVVGAEKKQLKKVNQNKPRATRGTKLQELKLDHLLEDELEDI